MGYRGIKGGGERPLRTRGKGLPFDTKNPVLGCEENVHVKKRKRGTIAQPLSKIFNQGLGCGTDPV